MCKHGKAVEIIILYRMEKNDGVEQIRLREPLLLCHKCKNSNVRKDGTRSKKYSKPAQRYKCAMCKARFSDDIGFAGRHYPPSAILLALMYSMGLSGSQISRVIVQTMQLTIHQSAIQAWAVHYSMVDKYTRKLSTNTGCRWSVDEKSLNILGKGYWLFSVMDYKTRLILSWNVSPHKLNYNACGLFKDALESAVHLPALVSDGLQVFKKVFKKAFKKIFYRRKSPRPVHGEPHKGRVLKQQRP